MASHIQYIYKLLVILLYSFFITIWSIPYLIRKLKKFGYVVQDKYKKGKTKVPTMGGLAMLGGILVSLALSQILLSKQDLGNVFIFYFIVIVYALYGTIDDMFSFEKRYDKIIVLLVLSLPIASMISDTTLNLIFTTINIGSVYALLIIPVYIMVVANLINVHAGYNGLTQGLGLILLVTITLKSYMVNGFDYLIFIMPVIGAAIAFLPNNMYPAKILPGNVGDMIIGAAIGAFIAINNFLWFGVFILIPHIINFLMDTYTLVLRKIPDKKFGTLRKDGTIQAPPTMKYKSLKFLIVSLFDLTEKQAVYILYAFTALFCVIGLLVF